MKTKMIVLMGGQGVGKGTFSKMLKNDHEYNHIETGAILRSAAPDSDIAKTIARGELVSDEQLFSLIQNVITDDHDIILDGFPRTTSQAKWLVEKYADKFNMHIIYLDVSEEIMIQRIQKRINDGGNRQDDADAAAIRRRLDTFWKTTVPAIDWLRTVPNIKFADIDVSGAVDENYAKICTALEK